MLNVGVIGLGFMGSTHVRCYQSAASAGVACRLAGVADHDAGRLSGVATAGNIATGAPERLFDPARVRAYAQPLDLIADGSIDAVSICTHTRTHVPLAIAALRAGKHVLVEKPVSLEVAEAQSLADEAALRPHLVCMPAMVMRFWPGWPMVRDLIAQSAGGAGAHGRLRSLALSRRGSTPGWSPRFYANLEESGGALFDLHVHDADFVLWALGAPEGVCSAGDLRHVTTLYRFPHASGSATGGPGPVHVTAEGGTDHDPAYGFHIRLTAVFEGATIDFDLSRTPNLLVASGGVATPVPAPPEGPFDHEIRAFVGACLVGGSPAPQPVSVGDAVRVIRLLHAERRSMAEGREVRRAEGGRGGW